MLDKLGVPSWAVRELSRPLRNPARMSRSSPTTNARKQGEGLSRRSAAVWVTLLAAMTLVGGLLVVLDGKPLPRLDGRTLPALVAAGGANSIEEIYRTRQPLETERWQAIVIHHSGSPVGSAASIESEHKARNFNGLGYHFVVGNGHGMGDGELYVGYRWLDQLPGAHTGGPDGDWFNRRALGICLVGDGQRGQFTDAQLQRLVQLVTALAQKLDIPQDRILLHSDVAQTANPGRFFPEAAFREQLASAL